MTKFYVSSNGTHLFDATEQITAQAAQVIQLAAENATLKAQVAGLQKQLQQSQNQLKTSSDLRQAYLDRIVHLQETVGEVRRYYNVVCARRRATLKRHWVVKDLGWALGLRPQTAAPKSEVVFDLDSGDLIVDDDEFPLRNGRPHQS